MGQNLMVEQLTAAHSYPDMTKTYTELQRHLQKTSAYKFIAGRGTKYEIVDMLNKGLALVDAAEVKGGTASDEAEGDEEVEIAVELADLLG